MRINRKFFKGPKPEIAAQMRKMLTVAERDNSNAFEVHSYSIQTRHFNL